MLVLLPPVHSGLQANHLNFPFFEKKENTTLSPTSLDEFPAAKPSWSLKCRGTEDTRLLREDVPAASSPKLISEIFGTYRVFPSLSRDEMGFPGIAGLWGNATGSEIRYK